MGSPEEIRELVASCLTDERQFVVDVKVPSGKHAGKVLVIIDGDEGVSIDDCAEVSRKLSKALDETEWSERHYVLEVSTPGLDQPLRSVRQYRKNIGRNLKVKTHDASLEGMLREVDDIGIVIEETLGGGKKKETKEVRIPFDVIEKALVLISFK